MSGIIPDYPHSHRGGRSFIVREDGGDGGDGEDGEDGGDGVDIQRPDFNGSHLLFLVTTSVVAALLGVSQVTPSAIACPPVPKQALDPGIARVMA
ncbi:hypothetical protein [Oscillatoria acuminata]|uniref:hypothetical protein n=1 Tax=Oscillatoria acuminata TaxID=118323 RepID=UPI0005C677E0|nr:hypothetical protein [Oscillatoria acuminata]